MKNKADRQEVVADASLNLSQGKGAYMRHFGTRTLVGLLTTLVLLLMSGVLAQVTIDYNWLDTYMNLYSGTATDLTGDGYADKVEYDTNGDGQVDAFRLLEGTVSYAVGILAISNVRSDTQYYFDDDKDGWFELATSDTPDGSSYIATDPEGDGTLTDWIVLDSPVQQDAINKMTGGPQINCTPGQTCNDGYGNSWQYDGSIWYIWDGTTWKSGYWREEAGSSLLFYSSTGISDHNTYVSPNGSVGGPWQDINTFLGNQIIGDQVVRDSEQRLRRQQEEARLQEEEDYYEDERLEDYYEEQRLEEERLEEERQSRSE